MRCRPLIIILLFLTTALNATAADFGLSVGISVPGMQIGIQVPPYPALRPVPGSPG